MMISKKFCLRKSALNCNITPCKELLKVSLECLSIECGRIRMTFSMKSCLKKSTSDCALTPREGPLNASPEHLPKPSHTYV